MNEAPKTILCATDFSRTAERAGMFGFVAMNDAGQIAMQATLAIDRNPRFAFRSGLG